MSRVFHDNNIIYLVNIRYMGLRYLGHHRPVCEYSNRGRVKKHKTYLKKKKK